MDKHRCKWCFAVMHSHKHREQRYSQYEDAARECPAQVETSTIQARLFEVAAP